MNSTLHVAWVGALALAGHLAAQAPSPTRQGPPPIKSPEVNAARMVTFRLRAPDAKRVTVVVSEIMRQVPGYSPNWATGTFNDDEVEMTKSSDGVWSLTVGPVLPDKYDYSFKVDGVHTLDPVNLDLKPGDAAVENWLTVRGASRSILTTSTCPMARLRH